MSGHCMLLHPYALVLLTAKYVLLEHAAHTRVLSYFAAIGRSIGRRVCVCVSVCAFLKNWGTSFIADLPDGISENSAVG